MERDVAVEFKYNFSIHQECICLHCTEVEAQIERIPKTLRNKTKSICTVKCESFCC